MPAQKFVVDAITRLGDVNRIKPTLAEFAKAGDCKHAGLRAFGLQPFPAFAAPIETAAPLRDDALRPNMAHGLEQLLTDPQDVIDVDNPFAPRRADHIPQQHLAVFNWAAPEILAVEMQQIEREIGEPLRSTVAYGIAQRIEMRDAALIGNRDLAIQNHRRQPGIEQRPERFPE